MKLLRDAVLVPLPVFVYAVQHDESHHLTLPLMQHRSRISDFASMFHGSSPVARFIEHNLNFTSEPETYDAGFWYGSFGVGESRNLSLLIDTGSGDFAVNRELYVPSKHSKDLNHSGVLEYGTWKQNGCRSAKVKYDAYLDTVAMLGLAAQNQTFGKVVEPNGSLTKFPHDGIAGMIGEATISGKKTWIKNLCEQGQIKECRFGLAFGTSGRGRMIIGGVGRGLLDADLTTPAPPDIYGWKANVVINGTRTLISNRTMGPFDSGTATVYRLKFLLKQSFR